jgi:hypothetical protein
MSHAKTVLFGFGLAVFSLFVVSGRAQVQKTPSTDAPALDQRNVIKVTIATLDPTLGPPTRAYRPGQKIPIAINLTNTSNVPVYSCLSGDLYQDLPRLKRDGKVVPYTSWQSYILQSAEKNQTCLNDDIPASTLLMPDTPTLVDSLIVTDDNIDPTGALAWYDPLPPGHYELSLQRRFACCDGPMVDSNTINFDVAP